MMVLNYRVAVLKPRSPKGVTLFTVLYSRFLNCAKDVSKVTAQPTILEYYLYMSTE